MTRRVPQHPLQMLPAVLSSLRFSASIAASLLDSDGSDMFAPLACSALSAAGEPDVPGTGGWVRLIPGLAVLAPDDREGFMIPSADPIPDE